MGAAGVREPADTRTATSVETPAGALGEVLRASRVRGRSVVAPGAEAQAEGGEIVGVGARVAGLAGSIARAAVEMRPRLGVPRVLGDDAEAASARGRGRAAPVRGGVAQFRQELVEGIGRFAVAGAAARAPLPPPPAPPRREDEDEV